MPTLVSSVCQSYVEAFEHDVLARVHARGPAGLDDDGSDGLDDERRADDRVARQHGVAEQDGHVVETIGSYRSSQARRHGSIGCPTR